MNTYEMTGTFRIIIEAANETDAVDKAESDLAEITLDHEITSISSH